jgi:hypothetical protein
VNNGKLKFAGWGHDLMRLAAEAGFALDNEEAAFLRVSCNPCIVSFGRYPMGLSKSNAPGAYHIHTGAFRHFETIFLRAVEAALRQACDGADDNRCAELLRLLGEVGNDVPQSTLLGSI